MRVCGRAVNFVQVINAEGDIRVCGWNRNNIIGNLIEQDFDEILHSKEAERIRRELGAGDYSNCDVDDCPYLSNHNMKDILIDIEDIPDYPTELHLAYEGICNYSCTCCSSCQHMEDTRKYDYGKEYELLEQKLKNILPHVKKLGANGRGELFASKRILKLLREWKPLAPVDEIEVILETNGSMFDEKHWKEIENLGQYHLSVAITIMSFNEDIYQHLSGTKLPISKLESNLRYVKKLHDEGIINHLELATVLQEENFREMPEFTKRCIEEYGADIVRIRPIFPGGIYDYNIQWFMDVRNPEHPYYSQYVKIMEHPVFQHPKVLLWSNHLPSTKGKHPGMKAEAVKQAVECILSKPDFFQKMKQEIIRDDEDIYLYGIGILGKLLLRLNQGELLIKGIFDKFSTLEKWEDIPIMKIGDCRDKEGIVIVTVYAQYESIKQELRQEGFMGEIMNLYEFLEEEVG